MKHAALLLALLAGSPAWAGLQINSNDVRVNVDRDDVDEWKDKYEDNCSTVEIGNLKVSNEECDGKGKNKNKNKENSSVHGDNNPGKGHNKNKNK